MLQELMQSFTTVVNMIYGEVWIVIGVVLWAVWKGDV